MRQSDRLLRHGRARMQGTFVRWGHSRSACLTSGRARGRIFGVWLGRPCVGFLRITHTVVMLGDARSFIRLDGFLFNFYLEFYALAQNKHVNSYSNDFESTSLSCMLSQQPRCP